MGLDTPEDAALRSRQRASFAKSLYLLPETLRELHIEYGFDTSADHILKIPQSAPADRNAADPLSTAFRAVLQRLEKAGIRTALDSNVLWPLVKDGPAEIVEYPLMKSVGLNALPIDPSGLYLLNADDGSINADALEPWVSAAGRAAARMPRLEMLDFATSWAKTTWYGVFDISYYPAKSQLHFNARSKFSLRAQDEELWKKASQMHSERDLDIVIYGP